MSKHTSRHQSRIKKNEFCTKWGTPILFEDKVSNSTRYAIAKKIDDTEKIGNLKNNPDRYCDLTISVDGEERFVTFLVVDYSISIESITRSRRRIVGNDSHF